MEVQQARLSDLFADHYDELFQRLLPRFRSREFTFEVLHETYLRIARISDVATAVQNPRNYFISSAMNVARNRWKADNYRRTNTTEIENFLFVADDAPGPARIIEARSEVDALKFAIAALPERQRAVLHGVAFNGDPMDVVARQLNVSASTAGAELKLAIAFCAKRLKRQSIRRSGGPRPKI